MRSGGRLWMVTLGNREPEGYEEDVPCYFRTRRAAESYRDEMAGWHDIGEWPYCDEDVLVVRHAPDDVRKDDIAWDDGA